MGRGGRRVGRAPAYALARSLLALLGVVTVVVLVPGQPSSAAPTAAELTLEVDKTSSPSGADLSFTAGFSISNGNLQNAQVQIVFPRDQYAFVFPTGGGIGTTTTTDGDATTVTFFLGKVSDGTIGSVSAHASSLRYLPHGTQVTATATISGIGLPPVAAFAPATTTVSSAAAPQLLKEVLGVTEANGPGAHSAEAGYQVTYGVRATSNCGGVGSQVGCLPFDGTLTETLPPESFLVSIAHGAEYLDRADGQPPDVAAWTFPADTPLGADLSNVPAVGTGPGGTIAIPVHLPPVNSQQGADGEFLQGDGRDAQPFTTTLTNLQFVDGQLRPVPPILEVTVWVPASSVPAGGLQLRNTARLTGPLGNGQEADVTAIADAPINVAPIGGDDSVTIVKPMRLGFNTDCLGYGNAFMAAWDPQSGIGFQPCVFHEGKADKYVIDVQVLNPSHTLANPRVTDIIPDELLWAGINDFQPAGWARLFSDDAACDEHTPDAEFRLTVDGKIHCVRWLFDGVWNAENFGAAGFHALFLPWFRPDPGVVDLAPGEFVRTTNVVVVTGSNLPTPRTATQDVAIIDRYDQSFHVSGAVGAQNSVVEVSGFATPEPREGSQAGPHDWTVQLELPPQVSFVGVTADPWVTDTNGAPVTPTCDYDSVTHRVVCVASGDIDPVGSSLTARVAVRIDADAPDGFYALHGCSYSQPAPGSPVNAAGQSLLYAAVGTPTATCGAQPTVTSSAANIQVLGSPPPDPRTGDPLVTVTKSRLLPQGQAVAPGGEVTYELRYEHQPTSDGDLHSAFVYDFLGRHPVSGAVVGDVVPEFVSARSTHNGFPETLQYTCTPNPSITNPAVTWGSSPACGTVTGLRWQLNSTVAPLDPPGTYRVSDPAGFLSVTVRVPADAAIGDVLANIGGIDADALPPAAGQRLDIRVGGEPPEAADSEELVTAPGEWNLFPTITDPDGDLDLTSTKVLDVDAPGVTVVWDDDGYFRVTLGADAPGTVVVHYEACDVTDLCDDGFLTLHVNRAPVAGDDEADAIAGGYVVIDTYLNDVDPDGTDLRQGGFFVAGFTNGFAELSAGGPADGAGVIRYFAPGGFVGDDTGVYVICDVEGACDEGEITVHVSAAATPNPPVAADDAVPMTDAAIDIDVVANDTDPDGDIDRSSVEIVDGPDHGQVAVAPNGVVTYTPDPGATEDGFTYRVCDAFGLCDEASVTIGSPSPPDAVDDDATVTAGGSVVVDVVANDTDPDGDLDPSTVQVTSPPSKGTTSVDPATGAITYTADIGATGTDSFTYEVCDALGACDEASVVVTFEVTSNPPVASDDAASVAPGGTTVVDVLANDSDADGDLDPTSVSLAAEPAQGTATVDPVTGAVTYVADAGAAGTDSFTYQVCDDAGTCDTATVTVTFTIVTLPSPPVAVDDPLPATPGVPATVDVAANDTDPDGDIDPSTVQVTSPPTQGTTSVDPATGAITYTPNADAAGTDSFTYEICDTTGLCDTATVEVSFAGGPIAVDDPVTVTPGVAEVVDVLANDTDPDGDLDPSTVHVTSPPSQGTTSVDPATGAIIYTPNAGAAGTDSFTYEVCDSTGLCDTATVEVSFVEPHAPTAVDDTASVAAGESVLVAVLGNDVDDLADLLAGSVQVVAGPAKGTTTVDASTGAVTYTANGDAAGTDVFTYRVCDATGACDEADVTVTITARAPRPPDAVDDDVTVDEGEAELDVLANDTDPDGDLDPSTVTITEQDDGIVVTVDPQTGRITFVPPSLSPGSGTTTFRFTYEVCDATGLCDTAVATVRVRARPRGGGGGGGGTPPTTAPPTTAPPTTEPPTTAPPTTAPPPPPAPVPPTTVGGTEVLGGTVTPPPAPPPAPGSLARTGPNLAPVALTGAVLLLLGAVIERYGRARRRLE